MTYIIGLDFGTESARGVLVNVETGKEERHHVHSYRNHVMTTRLPSGTSLPIGTALQNADDYLEAASDILSSIARGEEVLAIGVDFTASSPMPVTSNGTPLSRLYADNLHSYVKLWKHSTAHQYAEFISKQGGGYLDHCGGRLSGEWMVAKAVQIAQEDPEIWRETARFIEAGDWLVWQLCGNEKRSSDFASYKMHYTSTSGYPASLPTCFDGRLTEPARVGTPAGSMTSDWLSTTGIIGRPSISVAVIDSHVVLPAVGVTRPGTLVGALGTSAVFLLLDSVPRPLPSGFESMAFDAVLPDLWCFEAGMAGVGDMLSWFVRTFPRSSDPNENFRSYNKEAEMLPPGANHLVTLDWWNGNRVPHRNSALSGVISGFTMGTTAAGLYRSLLEAVCFGARRIVDALRSGGHKVERIILTSGLARNNPLLVQIAANVFDSDIEVPDIDNPTAVGAAIHGAVACKLVKSFQEGAERFGGTKAQIYKPDAGDVEVYQNLYKSYLLLADNKDLIEALQLIRTSVPALST